MSRQTEYFLEVELIALDESLCRVLDRTMRLRDKALEQHRTEEAEKISRVNKVLVSTRRRLGRLSQG
jgi:hypothetical protein